MCRYTRKSSRIHHILLSWAFNMLKNVLFIHCIGKKRFRNLLKHYQLNGVTPRVHGNVKRRPWNAASFPDKERAVTFIKNFAEAHALPLPGQMPKFYDYRIMLLPSDVSKASVHREYVEAAKKLEETTQKSCFGYREFAGCGQKLFLTFVLCHQLMTYVLLAKTTLHLYLNQLISAKMKNPKGYK